MSALLALLGFVLALLLLVGVHEWGHFYMARRLGMPVERFAIGMGRALWSRRWRGIEWRLGWLPLGGYVLFSDAREHALTAEQAERSFARSPVWARALVVLAGPGINLLLAWALMVLVLWAGVVGPKAWLAPGPLGTPWAQVSGDDVWLVRAVNGQAVDKLDQLPVVLLRQSEAAELVWTLESWQGQQCQVVVAADVWRDLAWQAPSRQLSAWGLAPASPPIAPVVAALEPDGPAMQAGMRVGDRVMAVNGLAVDQFADLAQWVREHPGEGVLLTLLREEQTLTLAVTLGERQQAGGRSGFLGMRPQLPDDWEQRWFSRAGLSLPQAMVQAHERLWDITVLTLSAIGRLVTGQSGLEQLAGPVGIAQAAGGSLQRGWISYVQFLALLSLSLAVLNLLPLPMLDGGHLLLYVMESLRGKSLSDVWMQRWQQAGLIMIVTLTLLAVSSDVHRLFGG